MPSGSISNASIRRISAASSRSAALAVALAALAAVPAAAQRAAAAGRVVRATAADSVPVAGARVVLHRVGRDAQGPIDSASADARGRFAFRFRADTSALFLVSSRWAGIEYFSVPIRLNPAMPDTAIVLAVHDTSSRAPVRVTMRHLVVSAPREDGRRSVLELLFLANESAETRVAPDSTRPVWRHPLPAGAAEFETGEGEVSAAAIQAVDDTLEILAPLAPGERQLVYRYSVPGVARVGVPVLRGTDSVSVLLEEREGRIATTGFAQADSQVIEGKTYRQWGGAAREGGAIVVEFPDRGAAPRTALLALVAALGAAILVAAGLAVRRRGGARADGVPRAARADGAAAPEPAALIDALARLDARHAGREAELDDAALAAYRAERARLRAALDRALAARRQGT